MSHFFAADGNQDNFDDIGRFAPDSVSQAKVKIGTSFDVALWGGKDLYVTAEPMHRPDAPPGGENVVYGLSLQELPAVGDIRKFRCECQRTGTFRIQTYTRALFGSESVRLEVIVGDGSMTRPHFARFESLRTQWIAYRATSPNKFDQLRQDLYMVRNAGDNGNPPISAWPPNLIDPDDGTMASIEHYFLCRAWVGNGVYNASQMRAQTHLYDWGKQHGLTPRHNPNKPTTQLTELQLYAQEHGIQDGEADLKASGKPEPGYKKPPMYY